MKTSTPHIIEEIRDLLKTSVSDVFMTIFNLEVQEAPLAASGTEGRPLVAGSVGFVGDLNGIVYVYVTQSYARTLASRMLGMAEAELEGDEMVNDVMGELTNIIVGGVKSRLCDSGNPCVLTIPSIVRGKNISAEPACAAEGRIFAVTCDNEQVVVEILMKQPC
jgi:chemotaxis protein CheX